MNPVIVVEVDQSSHWWLIAVFELLHIAVFFSLGVYAAPWVVEVCK